MGLRTETVKGLRHHHLLLVVKNWVRGLVRDWVMGLVAEGHLAMDLGTEVVRNWARDLVVAMPPVHH